jgi:GTP-binding protein
MAEPIIAVVGRPNVGKSELFNRLVGSRIAIVQDEPGITRDRIYAKCTWNGKTFTLVDTGGLMPGAREPLISEVQKQTQRAILEASLILFLVDAREGLHPLDHEIAQWLRTTDRKMLLLANKVDNFDRLEAIYEFVSLGHGEPFPISALHGTNIGELLDLTLSLIEECSSEDRDEEVRLSIVGRRNVGKSSLTNAILGEERSIVDSTAGTTRDCVDSYFTVGENRYIITDTSGLRRKGKMDEKVEYYSSIRTLRAISASTCALFVLNAEEGIVEQDKKIAEEIQKAGKASLILINKWDVIKSRFSKEALREKREEYRALVRNELYFIDYSPVLFISAKERKGIQAIFPKVEEIMAQFTKRVETSLVNKIFHEAQSVRPAPSYKGQQLKIFYAFQDGTCPPRFTLKVNSPKLVHFSYRRYLENTLRKTLGFTGTPLIINFSKK